MSLIIPINTLVLNYLPGNTEIEVGNKIMNKDLNNDNITDLIVGDRTGIHISFGNGDGTFKRSTLYSIGSPVYGFSIDNFVKDLKIAWQWRSDNFGKLPDHNWEVTPLMVGGVLYFTAGTRRAAG